MRAHAQAFGGLFEGSYDVGMGYGREILRHVVRSRPLAADGAGHNNEVANFHVILQRTATADAYQRFRAGGAKDLGGYGGVRRIAAAVADGDSFTLEGAGMHLIVEKGEILAWTRQQANHHLAALPGAGDESVRTQGVSFEAEHRDHLLRREMGFREHRLNRLRGKLQQILNRQRARGAAGKTALTKRAPSH